ncbi:MAG TPA: multicopper oxidase domain-containing protein [Rhodothermales bacterium]|nr:multicopper oxidase domain-containing protein [Rhodothermales bacterium]
MAQICGTLLVLGLLISAGCASTALPEQPMEPPSTTLTSRLLTNTLAESKPLKDPLSIHSVNGLLDITMEVVFDTFQVPQSSGSPKAESLRVYKLIEANGVSYADSANAVGFPGPTLRAQPGDSVRILLINTLKNTAENQLPCQQYPASDSLFDVAPNCFHGPENTNIHYHGFHVTPSGSGDNVLLKIKPAGTDSTSIYDRIGQFQYAFHIPENQSPGTHWYHPHKHGSVALQVMNGMAGAFIVEGGGLDSLTAANNIRERVLVVQQIDQNLNLIGGTQGRVTLINGQASPIIEVNAGAVERWRIVNATVQASNMYKFVFQDNEGTEPSFYPIARDGVQFAPANYNPNKPDTLLVAPGNRLDVFVQAPTETGLEELEALITSHLLPEAMLAQMQAAQLNDPFLRMHILEPPDTPYATSLPPALPNLPAFLGNLSPTPGDTSAFIVFSEELTSPSGTSKTNPPNFFLGKLDNPQMKYSNDVANPFLRMPLGATQTWKVINYSATVGGGINHPFHIHINPFQVAEVVAPRGAADPNWDLYQELNAAADAGYPIWLDTIALPLADKSDPTGNPGYVVIRQRYDNFTGAFVMHCHILGHEERGMMQLLEIVNPF